MGVELNFLMKKRRVLNASRVIAGVAFLAFVLASAVLYIQWDSATALPAAAESEAPVDEAAKQQQAKLFEIQLKSVPYVKLYQEVREALGPSATIRSFAYTGGEELHFEATFTSFDEVSVVSGQLQRLRYVRAVRTGESTESQGAYNAALILDMNTNGLRSLSLDRGPK